MKAISIRNPYATAILKGKKKYEYRTWSTNHRGDLLICSSANPKVKDMLSGYALCVVNIKDVHKVTIDNYKDYGISPYDRPRRDEVIYAWEITDVRAVEPFPVKGKLNFYYIDDDKITYRK